MLWAVISAAFTGMVIQYSYSHGKLACPPFYDDVSYFEDGLHRLAVLYNSGIGRLIQDYRSWPPHSPFSTFLAMGAFLLLGIHDWAPYAANGLLVFGLLSFIDFLTPELTTARKLALILFVLCIPVASATVGEFRPDVPSALCLAMGAAMLLWRSPTRASWRYRAAAGALFGLGLLFKPSTSPLTLMLFFVSLGLATAVDFMLLRPPMRRILDVWWQCTVAMVLIPLPHYWIDWREIWNYIYDVIFGASKSIWQTPGPLMWRYRYYLTGEGGEFLIGRELAVLLGIIGGGALIVFLLKRREPAARLAAFLAVALAAYLVPTEMEVKERFFGASMTWLLVFTALYLLWLVGRNPGRAPVVVLSLLVLWSLRNAQLGPHLYGRGSRVVLARNRVVNDIYNTLRAQGINPHTRIYITTTGYVNAGVLDYYHRRDTLRAMNIEQQAFSGDLQLHKHQMDMAEFVIASEQGNSEAWGGFIAGGNIQDQTLALVRQDKDFEQIAEFPTLTPKRYFLFRRVGHFFGWQNARGLIETEPQMHRGNLYTGIGPSTELTVPPGSSPKLCLLIRAHPRTPGEQITVALDGRPVDKPLPLPLDPVEDLAVPIILHSGGAHQLELRYTTTDGKPVQGNALTYERLELVPDDLK